MPQAITALGTLLEIPQALFVMMNLIQANSNVFEFLVNTGNTHVTINYLHNLAGVPALLIMINSNNVDAQGIASEQLAKMSSVEEFKLQIMGANNNTVTPMDIYALP
jgi:hypothetical protein